MRERLLPSFGGMDSFRGEIYVKYNVYNLCFLIFLYMPKKEKCPVTTGVTFFVCVGWVCRKHFHKLDG
jgi:hypothetical protein